MTDNKVSSEIQLRNKHVTPVLAFLKTSRCTFTFSKRNPLETSLNFSVEII